MAQVQWLVDIPPEIRLKIYEEYCKSLTVKVCKTTSHLISAGPVANEVAVNEPIAILLTSKTVRAEAIPIFLNFVTFTISEICCVDPISPNFSIPNALLRAKHVVWEVNCYHPASRYETPICIAYHLRKLRRLGGLKIEHLRKTSPFSIFSTGESNIGIRQRANTALKASSAMADMESEILSSMLLLVLSSISALQFSIAATDFCPVRWPLRETRYLKISVGLDRKVVLDMGALDERNLLDLRRFTRICVELGLEVVKVNRHEAAVCRI